jgi:hypothetical protein
MVPVTPRPHVISADAGAPDAAPAEIAPEPPHPSTDIPFPLPDPTHIDLQAIAAQALGIARKQEPAAWLSTIWTVPKVIGGSIDLTTGGNIGYEFSYHRDDPAAPPGLDRTEGLLILTLNTSASPDGGYVVWAHVRRQAGGSAPKKPRDLPRCTLARAWAKATAAGVPTDAVANVRYTSIPLAFGYPFVWGFTIAGHSELTRTIDADTCELTPGGPGNTNSNTAHHPKGPP